MFVSNVYQCFYDFSYMCSMCWTGWWLPNSTATASFESSIVFARSTSSLFVLLAKRRNYSPFRLTRVERFYWLERT